MSYNAFDPRLQLWVAACLYRYYIDQHEFLYGPLDDDAADAVYPDARKLGTTLQVRADMWPPDRVAFDEFWKRSLDELRIDPPVREHLHGVAAMAFLPAPLRLLAGRFNLFATTGFLPTEFRAHMRLAWTAAQQRRFEWLLTALRVADRVIPRDVWVLGYQLYLWDMRSAGAARQANRLKPEPYEASRVQSMALAPGAQPRRGHRARSRRERPVVPAPCSAPNPSSTNTPTPGSTTWCGRSTTALCSASTSTTGDSDERFTEFKAGLDHVGFGCANRGELEKWVERLDELGIEHGGIVDAPYGSGLSFRDPDGIALEFFAPPE